MNFNKVMFAGNLTKDPVIRTYGDEDKLIASSTLAINDVKNKENVLFLDFKCFGAIANVIEKYTKKGDPLFICGQLKQENWTDKEGNKKNKMIVLAQEIQLLGIKPKTKSETQNVEIEEDDVPF